MTAALTLGVLVSLAAGEVPPVAGGFLAAARVPDFNLEHDTFAFRNDIRSRNPNRPDLYANYCFVLARGVRQFHAFARFDPGRPRLTSAEYGDRVRRVASHAPWKPALPLDDRVVIPGYRDLYEFSRDQEATVKKALGGRFWTWVHWTNWRVTLRLSDGHQEDVASEIVAELDRGRLVQLLVTNWPVPELNHTVVAYEYRATDSMIDFTVYDPNDPQTPWVASFNRRERHFWATRMFEVVPGKIRAFRMYYSRFL